MTKMKGGMKKGGGDIDTTNTTNTEMSPTTVADDNYVKQAGLVDTIFGYFTIKNIAIFVLLFLLILSFLGVNLLLISGNMVQYIVALIGPFVNNVLSIFGYTAGTIVNTTADVVADTAKTGIDIAEGTAYSVGNLLRNSSNVNGDLPIQMELNADILGPGPVVIEQPLAEPPLPPPPPPLPNLDTAINRPVPTPMVAPEDDTTNNPIQNTLSSNKSSWCLVGEYQGRRGCVELAKGEQCQSGKVFNDQATCLNLGPNSPPTTINQPTQNQPPLMNWGTPPPLPPPGSIYNQRLPPPPPRPMLPPPPGYGIGFNNVPPLTYNPPIMPGYNGMPPPRYPSN